MNSDVAIVFRGFLRQLTDLIVTGLLTGIVMWVVGWAFSSSYQGEERYVTVMRPIEDWTGWRGFAGVAIFGLFVVIAYMGVRRAIGSVPNFRGREYGTALGFGLFLLSVPLLFMQRMMDFDGNWTDSEWLWVQAFVQFLAAGFLVGSLIDGVTIRVSSTLPVSADRAWSLLLRTDTFLFITRGMMGFDATENWPESLFVEGATHELRVRPLNLPPCTRHVVAVERVDAAARQVETRENGGAVRQWNHRLSIEPVSETECRYEDRVQLFAGPLTLGVAAFAAIFYRHRHRRWRRLVEV